MSKTSAPPPPAVRARALRLALVGVVVGLAVLAVRAGLLDVLAEPETLGRTIADLGPLGYLAFVGAYALFQPFGAPGTVFVFAAPLIWPWPVAFALNMTGTMLASVVGFSFARFVGRDFVASRIPARFRAYDEALERRAFWTVVTLRFVFWMPPLLHAFFGVSRVRFGTHFWGSLVGYLVPLFVVSYFGRAIVDAVLAMGPRGWGVVGAVVFGVVAVFAVRRYRRRATLGRLTATAEDASSDAR